MQYNWIEISKKAFDHNCFFYKNLIGQNNKLAAVIKGNGYGHGLQEMAFLCENNQNVNWICVAQLSEALALKNVSKPILILGYSDGNPEDAINKNIYFMVDHLEYAHRLNDIGKKNKYQFKVHVKIDTGLSRMGVLPKDALNFITTLQKLPYIRVNGIYSHFSASDSNPDFSHQQLTCFMNIVNMLEDKNICIENIHMSNSGSLSTIVYPPLFNFFRIGLGLYGFGLEQNNLEPVMTWKTRIITIKEIPAHSPVSYTGLYTTTRPTTIALLPLGYYDGYKISFSNKTRVYVNGNYAPVLGRVAMNIIIIDITDISAKIGDEVTLLGKEEEITLSSLAKKVNFINPREIFTGINLSIPRIIIEMNY